MRSRILLGTMFGALGGFFGFLLQEGLLHHDAVLDMTMQDQMLLGAMVGAMLGIGIGAVEGAAVSSSRLLLRGTILGCVIGALGGMAGMFFGTRVYAAALLGHDPRVSSGGLLDFTHEVLARALGWTLLGAFPGLAAGAATLSRKRAIHGLAGGLLGGFLGGLVFDLAAELIGKQIQGMAAATSGVRVFEAGGPSRAIGFTLIGALTGLFIGLVEEYLKQAWVRVLAGKNEGKDYIISKSLTVVGRDERADIPVFGDPNLAPQHAAIRMENGRHTLLDGGAPAGSVVNGQRIQQQLLRDGDMIQLGQVRILFREKATANKVGRQVQDAPSSPHGPSVVNMPSHLCPFCGAQKDASGGCLCTVQGAGPPPMGQHMPPGMGVPGYAIPNPMAAPVGGPSYGDTGQYGFGAPGVVLQPGYGGMPAGFGPPPGMGQVATRLIALEGPYAGQGFDLSAPYITFGRDPGRDIPLTLDTTVSRNHGHIAQEGGQHVVYDDGSSNGTFVNNVRVTIQTLAPGDVVQLGASRFRYE